MEDKLVLEGGKNDAFSVKFLYLAFEQGTELSFPTKVIWNSWVLPRRASLFRRQLGDKF